MGKTKIFDVDYLATADLSDEDLFYLCDKNSLIISMIVGEFAFIKSPLSQNEIIKLCKQSGNWPYKYFWTNKQRENYTKKIFDIYKNLYRYSDERCKSMAEWFIVKYGFTNSSVKKNKKITQLNQ